MNTRINIDEKAEVTTTVRDSDTALSYGSGLLEVYSTPAMVAFMEKTSMDLVQPFLDKGFGTVGISINIKHLKAVPKGEKITCTSLITGQEGNKISFEVMVFHGTELVGSGEHQRYIIDEKRFLAKLS